MSNFGAKLAELLEKNKIRASELSRATGITEALISRWVNGQQKFVAVEDLTKLTPAISGLAKEQAELIKAHLLDELSGAGSELIEIKIRGASAYVLKETPTKPTVPLPVKIQRAIDILSNEARYDVDIKTMLISLANLVSPEVAKERSQTAIANLTTSAANILDASKRSE